MAQVHSLLVLVAMVVGQAAEASGETENETQPEARTTDEQHWEDYKKKFNKVYEDRDEDAKRKAIFLENKKTIDEHNEKFAMKQTSFQMGYSDRTDWTKEELHLI